MEFRNYNRKLFLRPPQKQAKAQPISETAVLHNKFTFWHIKETAYLQKNEFSSFVFSCLEIQRRLMQVFFALSVKKLLTNPQKQYLQKTFSLVCMLLVQLALINVFILYDNWKTFFFTKAYRYREIFSNHILLSLKQILFCICTVIAQC